MIAEFFLCAFVFALLNRVRGSELKVWFIRLDPVATWLIAGIISLMIYIPTHNNWYIIGGLLYVVGERPAWGKWIGTCIDGVCRFSQKGGIIGAIANMIVSEKQNCVLHSKVALTIRGAYWFAPCLLFAYHIMILDILTVLSGIAVIAICFPISVALGKVLPVPAMWVTKPVTWTTVVWSKSELIYGFIQGAVLWTLLLK